MPSYRFRSEKYVSRGFKDLAISFNANPSTGDIGVVKNVNAIKQSVRNLILTEFGERLEPRIEVTNVNIRDESDTNAAFVSIDYTIVGETQTQTVDFLLERA